MVVRSIAYEPTLNSQITPKWVIFIKSIWGFFRRLYSAFVRNANELPKSHLFPPLANKGLATLDIADCSPIHIPLRIGQAPQILYSRQ